MQTDSSDFQIQFQGNSMTPTLKAGDTIIVTPKQQYCGDTGDIILFSSCNEYTAHRVIAKTPIISKGDRSQVHEQPNCKKILGVIVGRIRNDKISYWGEHGQPFKKIISRLSSNIVHSRPRWFRWPNIVLLHLTSYLSNLYLTTFLKNHRKS